VTADEDSRGTFAETWHRGADGTWRMHRDLTPSREPDGAVT
jgi:hypothetical protein